MTAQENMLTPEEIKNTEKIQLKSLIGFMAGLGYEYERGWPCRATYYFYSYEYSNKSRVRVSFQTACKLHNCGYLVLGWDGKKFDSPFDFDAYSIKKALAAKIVVQCHLQQNKKTGFIRASSQLVEFVEPVYYDMFITSKYFPF